MTDTLTRLTEILVREYKIDPESLAPQAPLEELGIDSLGIAELLFTVEDEFRITVSKEPIKLTTVGDVVCYIDALIAAQHGGAGQVGVAGLPSS